MSRFGNLATDASAEPLDAARQAYYRQIASDSLIPLWTRIEALAAHEPPPVGQAHVWAYSQVRRHLLRSADLITAGEAERRVLVFENPGLPGTSRVTPMLYTGLQLLMPGEIAPAHRHTISALRFVIEGQGAYTSINGERVPMRPGDLVLTPNWVWHGHGHEGSEPTIWLDGLDVGLVTNFNAVFFERGGDDPSDANVVARDDRSDDRVQPWSRYHYPFEQACASLREKAVGGSPHPHHGYQYSYAEDSRSGFPIATLTPTLRLMPSGFVTRPYRATEGIVFAVVHGNGELIVNRSRKPFGKGDVFVVPNWTPYRLGAEEETILFAYSDRAAQEKLELFREAFG